MPHTAALVASLLAIVASAASLSAPTSAPKAALFTAIDTFNAATAGDGTVPIDFGVKGGELDKKSRAPRNLFPDGFDAVSENVGTAAKGVMAAVDALACACEELAREIAEQRQLQRRRAGGKARGEVEVRAPREAADVLVVRRRPAEARGGGGGGGERRAGSGL